jgi:hypothetical protein
MNRETLKAIIAMVLVWVISAFIVTPVVWWAVNRVM